MLLTAFYHHLSIGAAAAGAVATAAAVTGTDGGLLYDFLLARLLVEV